MRSARIRLRLGADVGDAWLDGFCERPALDRELVLGGQHTDGVETVTSYVVGDPDAYESLLANAPSVLEYDLTPDDRGCFAYVRRRLGEGGRSVAHALERETVVVLPPIELRSDRTLTTTLVGTAEDVATAIDELPPGIDATVLRVTDGGPARQPRLSDRQRDALHAAARVGYFEVPRRNGIEAVADELDCAVSTASGLVRRAQAALVEGELGPAADGLEEGADPDG